MSNRNELKTAIDRLRDSFFKALGIPKTVEWIDKRVSLGAIKTLYCFGLAALFLLVNLYTLPRLKIALDWVALGVIDATFAGVVLILYKTDFK